MRCVVACAALIAVGMPWKAVGGTLVLSKDVVVVSDPYGSVAPGYVPGAVLEYRIVASDPAGAVTDVVITDALPPAVTYVPGSLRIDGIPEDDDANDVDANPNDGNFTGGTVTVRVAAVASGATTTVTFRVTID